MLVLTFLVTLVSVAELLAFGAAAVVVVVVTLPSDLTMLSVLTAETGAFTSVVAAGVVVVVTVAAGVTVVLTFAAGEAVAAGATAGPT